MIARLLLLAIFCGLGVLLGLSEGAHAQQPAPTPDRPCAPGELCAPDEIPQPGEAEEGARAPVNDPPGRYLRSLSTMGLIAVIVGAYFFLAFSGKSLRLKR